MTVVLSSTQVTNASADDDLAEVIVHVHARIIASARARRTAIGCGSAWRWVIGCWRATLSY